MVFFSASGMILVEGLVFLYFVEELNLSYLVCGISVIITVLFELPMFHYSERLVQKFGHDWLIMLGLISYSTRVLICTLISENQKILIFSVEWLQGVTIGTITTARTLKVSEFVPKGFETTFQGVLAGFVSGGAFFGEILGSYGFEAIGKRATFRVASVTVFITGVIYFVSSPLFSVTVGEFKRLAEFGYHLPNLPSQVSSIPISSLTL